MTLTAEELAGMREAAEASLPDTCTIRHPTATPDAVGGVSLTWTETTGVPCRLAALSGQERYSGHKLTAFARYRLTVPYDADLEERDEVVVGGTAYRVLFVDKGKSWSLVKQADVERVE